MERFLKVGLVLQPRQLLASAAARDCDREGGPTAVGFGGARGGGKSHWMLAQMGADDCQRVDGLKCLLLRKVGKANLEHLEDLRKRLFHSLRHTFVAHRGILNFPNGSRIICGHFQHESDIDQYLGLEYDVIGVEEATTLTWRKMQDIRTCLRSSKPNWRPRAYLTTNPGGIGHTWFKGMFITPFQRKQETETKFVPAKVQDNRFNNREYAAVLEKLRGWQRAAWLEGDWNLPMGQYFTTFREDIHVLDEVDDTRIREWRAAMDYGFTHYTCVYLGGTDGDGNFFVVDYHRDRQKLPQYHAPRIKEMIARHRIVTPGRVSASGEPMTRKLQLGDLSRFVGGSDLWSKQSDGTTTAGSYAKLGIKMSVANTDRIQGWAECQRLFGDPEHGIPAKLFVHRRCLPLIECISALQHDPHRPEDVLKVDCDDEGNGGDDDADAFRYLVVSKGRKVKEAKLAGF